MSVYLSIVYLVQWSPTFPWQPGVVQGECVCEWHVHMCAHSSIGASSMRAIHSCEWSFVCESLHLHVKLHLCEQWALLLMHKAPLAQAEGAWMEGICVCVWSPTRLNRDCSHTKLHSTEWSFKSGHKCSPLKCPLHTWLELCACVLAYCLHKPVWNRPWPGDWGLLF